MIDASLKVPAAQRTLAEKYGFEVTDEFGLVVVTDPLVIKAFGKPAGRITADKTVAGALESLLAKMVEKHEAAEKTMTPAFDKAEWKTKAKAAQKKAAAVPKTAKAPKAPKASAAEGWKNYPDDSVIEILAKECPRRPGTAAAAHWELYKNGMTIAAFRKAGGERSRLETDLNRKSLKLRKATASGK